MIYPIKNWPNLPRGYRFGVPTFYSNFHLGLDVIAPIGTPVLAWQGLTVTNYFWGFEGGNTIFVKCPNNPRLFRLMHLQHSVRKGFYNEGEVLAYVDCTGSLCKGSHLHIDISKNGILLLNNHANFEDPEAYFKMTTT